ADTGDGDGFRPSGQVFAAAPWGWVAALLGLFAAAPPGTGEAGTGVFTRYRTTARPHHRLTA
ncbi:glycoside hydrolase, partial [Streptomyces sp. UH6]|nr:glycoside hydrolase [Streptomyces sp. UH6]